MRGSAVRALDLWVQSPGVLTTAGLFVFGCLDFNSTKYIVTRFTPTSWVSYRYCVQLFPSCTAPQSQLKILLGMI